MLLVDHFDTDIAWSRPVSLDQANMHRDPNAAVSDGFLLRRKPNKEIMQATEGLWQASNRNSHDLARRLAMQAKLPTADQLQTRGRIGRDETNPDR